MHKSTHLTRQLLGAGLIGALVLSSGCGWFRSSTGYEAARENRPLEVPPDLSAPQADPTMQLPSVNAPAATLSGAGAQQGAQPAAGSAVSSFQIADQGESAWRRVGIALERIDGVNVVGRAQLLGSYEVEYEGETVLVRIQEQQEASTISVLNAGGQSVSSGPATRLLGLLRQRLG